METLFHQGRLSDYLAKRRASLASEIQRLPADQVLQDDLSGLHQKLLRKYMLTPPSVRADARYAHPIKEVKVDVRRDPALAFVASGSTVPGLEITIAVPFDGDQDLLKYCPSTTGIGYPKGEVVNGEIWLTYLQVQTRETTVDNDLKRDLSDIAQYLKWVEEDVQQFNASLLGEILAAISERQATLAKASDVMGRLGIPVRPPKR